jgi:tetratricopeptide (TPR) repeat protein
MSGKDSTPGEVPVGPGTSGSQNGERLDGWKSIAGYLDRDIRTVQRWELNEQLPVHRLEHRQRGSAYAFTGELDEWMAKRDHGLDEGDGPDASRPRKSRVRRAASLAGGLLVLVVAVVFLTRAIGPKRPGLGNDSKDPRAYAAFVEGRALYQSRQYSDAAVSLERAISQDQNYGEAWAWLAKTYARLAQPVWSGGNAARSRADEAASRAASLAPSLSETHVALALAARARGDVERWRAEARRTLELDPRAAEALALLGDSYSAVVYACNRDEDPELAESYYRRAMELAPNMTLVASNRAGNLRRMGRAAECVDIMTETIRSFRDETPLLAVRGGCRLVLGDIAGAAEDIEPLRDNPKIARAGSLIYLGLLELKSGRTEHGIRDLEAVTRFDQSARSELIVAEAYGVAGDVGHATLHVKKALALDASCAGTVAKSLAFKPIRQAEDIKDLLAIYGIH